MLGRERRLAHESAGGGGRFRRRRHPGSRLRRPASSQHHLPGRWRGWICLRCGREWRYPTFGVAASDLDDDGDVDIAFGINHLPDRVCLNDGAGSFECGTVDGVSRFSMDVMVLDVDSNGTQDLVFAVRDGRNQVCLGDGAGAFTCQDIDENDSATLAMAAADFGEYPSSAGAEGSFAQLPDSYRL